MRITLTKRSETAVTPEETNTAVEYIIGDAGNYRNDLDAGEERIQQIRQYLDEMDILPAGSAESQIGSPDAVQTFPSFEAWVASFSGTNLGQDHEDEILLRNFKKTALSESSNRSPEISETLSSFREPLDGTNSRALVRLIITDLTLNSWSPNRTVDQLHVQANTEIREVLRMLKDRGTFPQTSVAANAWQDIPA